MNESFDVYRLIKSPDVNDTTTSAKRIKRSEKFENSVNLESQLNFSEDIKQENNTCEKHFKEKARCSKVSMKSSKNINCYDYRRLQKLEEDFKIFVADKSFKSNKNLRSSQKPKSFERRNLKNEFETDIKKSCNSISNDDTLILCIDQEEADEILFGDIKNNIKQKMELRIRSLKKV